MERVEKHELEYTAKMLPSKNAPKRQQTATNLSEPEFLELMNAPNSENSLIP
jgi:hypothetical protein